MTVHTLSRRLARIEGAQRASGRRTFFVVWAQSEAELRAVVAGLDPTIPRHALVGGLWPFRESPPAPRWVTAAEGIADRELAAMVAITEAEIEREGATAAYDEARSAAAARSLPEPDLMAAIFDGFRLPPHWAAT